MTRPAAPAARLSRSYVLRLSRPGISFRFSPGSLLVIAGAVLLTLVLLAIGTGSGAYPLAPDTVVQAVLGNADPDASYVVWTLRVPRLLTAVLAGAALALPAPSSRPWRATRSCRPMSSV